MKLVLIRHAEAGNPDPRRFPDDHDRPLTSEGEREHERIARGLARLGLGPTHLLTSPLRRARQTAEITARGLGWKGAITEVPALGDRFSVPALLEELGRCPEDAVVICVGHEPHLSRFGATLLHRDGALKIALAKSGTIGLECDGRPEPGGARLLFFLPPQELLRLLT